jgi:transcriptional regulator with XRE-family HTH domain
MDELGQILREARESKGLTLAEVQSEIRISTRFLEALESGEYQALPTPVHVRGFLRNYSRFLGLDPQPLLDRYNFDEGHIPPPVTIGSRETKPQTLLPAREDQPFFDPVNVDVSDGRVRGSESLLRLVIIAALIVALALVVNRFLPMLLGYGDIAESITDGIAQVLEGNGSGTVDLADVDATSAALIPGQVITSTSRNNLDPLFPTPFPTRRPLPATMDSIPLRLEVTERTWMEVTIDGDVVFSGIARAGDPPYEWEAQEEARLVTGNAIGVFVTIGSVELGRLGGRGENIEEVWRTTN